MARLNIHGVEILLQIASLFMVASVVGLPAHAQAPHAQADLTVVELVRRYGPSVVAVHLTVEDERIRPGGPAPQAMQGGGSGFVVDDQGHIVTNFHVVFAALEDLGEGELSMRQDARVTVSFQEQPEREFEVRIVGANPDFDLALLALEERDEMPRVRALPLGDSDAVESGQVAVAIGSPFGLHSTVTSGIISAIERDQPGLVGIEIPFIQTDAAINPGNSGGPLFNGQGEVIGINNAILASAAGPQAFMGVGFAVPINLLTESLDELRAGGLSGVAAAVAELPDRPRLGLSGALNVEDYPRPLHQELELPEHGIIVMEVSPGGPADRAGVEGHAGVVVFQGQPFPVGGDIITAADGRPTQRLIDLQQVVLEREAGDAVNLTVWREGKEHQVEVMLEVVPAE